MNLTGAVLTLAGTDSQVILEAGHDINLKTQALHSKADMTENANNYIRTERGTELGTDITATMTNEALTESIAKVAKDNPDVAQWLDRKSVV